MADFSTLKSQVAAVVRANGIQDIKGSNLQAQLFNIIDTMNAAKVDAQAGKGLSTNDLTTALVNAINSAVQPAALASAIAEAVADYVAKTDIVAITGTSTTKVMSQKAVTDNLNLKANKTDYVAKTDIVTTEGSSGTKVMSQGAVTNRLAAKADASDVYTKAEVDTALSGKMDNDGAYTKAETLGLLASKADTDDVYTKNAVDTKLAAKASQAGLDAEAALRVAADATLTTAVAAKANSADVYTKAQADAITNALNAHITRILRDFGMYSNPTEYVLSVGVNGKYIDKDSALEVANGNYSISQPVTLNAGDILLIPSASAVAAACSVVSKKVTNTYQKVIIYTYTYDEYGRVATATADYNPSLVYTAYYESDEQTTPTNWMIGGEHIADLPQTHEVTESYYEPLVRQSVAGMPETGYYVYLASQAMDVVVSAFNATINGGHAIIAGWGVFKNIATNFVGIDKQRVIAEAFADLYAQVEGINEKLTNGLDNLAVNHLHIGRELSGLNVAGTFCLQGAGVPSASVIPDNWDFERYGDWKGIPQFIGQEYFDTTNKVFYKAHEVGAVADWKRITNA